MPMDCYLDETDAGLLWLRIHGDMSWEAYDRATDCAAKLIRSLSHRVDVIYLVETHTPPGNPIPHFKRALDVFAGLPNFGIGVTVDAINEVFAKNTLDLVRRIHRPSQRDRYFYVENTSDALRIIEKSRSLDAITS